MTRNLISASRIATALGLPTPTPQQIAVIEHPPSPTLVVAGAGSGKTETMSARVVWLVANGFVEPERVLGLTFTRKAAAELAGRVGARLRDLARAGLWQAPGGADLLAAPPTISTYHAYAGRLVREHALRLGHEPDARLLSEAAAWQLAHEVVTAYDGPLDRLGKAETTITNAVLDLSGELAEHLVTPDELGDWLDDFDARLREIESAGRALLSGSKDLRAAMLAKRDLVSVLNRYARLKRERAALDFADQMALAARLSMAFADVGRIERERFGAVLLDEFQDTSHAQLSLLTSLFATAETSHCVTAVGDPHQSIYAWRGASAATLAQFPQAFGAGAVPVLALSTTWRNDRVILEAANTVAAPLREGAMVPVEPLVPAPTASAGLIEVARLGTVTHEAAAVAEWIAAQRRAGNQSTAVLCRKRSQFPPIVEALEARGLPVEVVGLGGLLLTPEVQDVVALLSVAHDAGRGDRLLRLLTGPVCRLGAADLDRFHAWARARQQPAGSTSARSRGSDLSQAASDNVSLVEGLVDLARARASERARSGLSAAALHRLLELAEAVGAVRAATGVGLADLVSQAERALGLDIEVLARPDYPPDVARAHLDAFTDVAADFAQSGDRPTLGGFLAWLDAAIAEERGLDRGVLDVTPGAVHVLTVHAAKGLEWDAVAVPGLTEAGFPVHSATTARPDADTGKWRIGDPQDGAWTVGLDGLPYDLRGDAGSLPQLAWRSAAEARDVEERRLTFRAEAGRAGIAEERRLAYVALTRARHALMLSTAIWGTQTSPRLVSRFLAELVETRPDLLHIRQWEPDPDIGASNPLLAQPLAQLWPRDPSVPAAVAVGAARVEDALAGGALAGGSTQPPVPQEVEVLLAERAAHLAGAASFASQSAPNGPWRLLDALDGHLSTSQLVQYATDPGAFVDGIRRPMPAPPTSATRRGTAFHAWLERHYRRAALLEPDDLPGSADPPVDADADLDALVRTFLASEWAEREPIEVEVMLETVIDDVALRARIDAVFAEPDGGVVIVDWKSGRPHSGSAAHAAAIQLAAYRTAYARLRGIEPARVRAAFYYAGSGQTIYPPLRSAADLAHLVAGIRGAPAGNRRPSDLATSGQPARRTPANSHASLNVDS